MAAQTEDLLCVAVDAAQNQTATEITAKVKHTGKYDRTKCDHKLFCHQPGMKLFDPSHALGEESWTAMLLLIATYFGRPACWKNEVAAAELRVKQCTMANLDAQEYIARMGMLIGRVKQAGGLWSDVQQIRIVLCVRKR